MAHDRTRFMITIAGVGAAVVLMLFLLALYEGVRVESNGYIASRPSQVWIAQENTTNFIKASSFLPLNALEQIEKIPEVAEASALLRLITTVGIGGQKTTAIFVGVDPLSSLGWPTVVEGKSSADPGELIMDRALARRYGARIGDLLLVQGRNFRLVGFSTGTNAVMTQFVFIALDEARELLGFDDMASYFLVQATAGISDLELAQVLRGAVAGANILTQNDFSNNNMRELRGGLLPILATVAVFGGVVGTSVLTLLLYGAIVERREEYAILKAIGAPHSYLSRLIVIQSLAAVSGGVLFGILLYLSCAPLIQYFVPVVVLSLPLISILGVAIVALLLGCLSALLPLRRVERIYPAELFRA